MEEFIKFETAKLAKEKNFEGECKNYYIIGNSLVDPLDKIQSFSDNETRSTVSCFQPHIALAPRQTLLQTWLRKKHKIFVEVYEEFGNYILHIHYYYEDNKIENWKHKGPYLTHEEALEIGLIEGLKLIK